MSSDAAASDSKVDRAVPGMATEAVLSKSESMPEGTPVVRG